MSGLVCFTECILESKLITIGEVGEKIQKKNEVNYMANMEKNTKKFSYDFSLKDIAQA